MIFAVLVSAAHVYGIFGLFIAAWILYQAFEAYHTAKARRDGQPLPDPLGLNELGSWINPGGRGPYTGPPPPTSVPGAGQAGPEATTGYQATGYQTPYQQVPYQSTYQGQYQNPYAPPAAGDPAGQTGPGAGVPPIPPIPPGMWRRKEPIGAIVLIALGLLFLLGQLDIFTDRIFAFSWPVLLIGLGVWLVVRRLGETHGGQK